MTDQTGEYSEKWEHIEKPKFLIRSTEHYIVFIDNNLMVDWETSRDYDKDGHNDEKKHNSVLSDAALLEATPCDWLTENMTLHFKRLIGEAIAHSLKHDYINAEKMIKSAKDYITARSKETSRFWYLSSSFVMTTPFVIAMCILWIYRDVFSQKFGFTLLSVSMAACAGAIGALLSVIGRSGNIDLDCYAGRILHNLEGASRILVGAIYGIVVALAIKTEMILAPLSRGKSMLAVVVLAALASGAGERLAKSIISTIDGQDEKSSTSKKNKGKVNE